MWLELPLMLGDDVHDDSWDLNTFDIELVKISLAISDCLIVRQMNAIVTLFIELNDTPSLISLSIKY